MGGLLGAWHEFPTQFGGFPVVEIDEELPRPGGFSRIGFGRGTNRREYFLKGARYTPEHPYVAANELICAELARLLGLGVPDFCVALIEDDLVFGSHFARRPGFMPRLPAVIFDQCENKDDL